MAELDARSPREEWRVTRELKPCPFCGSPAHLQAQRVLPDYGCWVVTCYACRFAHLSGTDVKEHAITGWNARADLPTPTLARETPLGVDRMTCIDFCPACFASEHGGSWNHAIVNGYCSNCGNGSCVSMPIWAIEEIRRQASWVGKRYYPTPEDQEAEEELQTLRGMQTEFPGRSVERDVDEDGQILFVVRQITGKGKYSTTYCDARVCGSAEQAWEKARTRLPYVSQEQLTRAKEKS